MTDYKSVSDVVLTENILRPHGSADFSGDHGVSLEMAA